jgi:type II secretory pathway pseudopilin PulG
MIIDLTELMLALVAGVFSILGPVAAYWFTQHIKDQQAADVVQNAVRNALGAMQQAAEAGIKATHPNIMLPPGTPPKLATGVQYVLDHAGGEADRLGIDTSAIADKINAQIGLKNIATNEAIAASPLPPMPKPLDPVPTDLSPLTKAQNVPALGSQSVVQGVALSPRQG